MNKEENFINTQNRRIRGNKASDNRNHKDAYEQYCSQF